MQLAVLVEHIVVEQMVQLLQQIQETVAAEAEVL
jgi:hypothetical protein